MADSLRFFASPSTQSTSSRSGSFTEMDGPVFDRTQQGIDRPGWDSLDYIMEAEDQSVYSESSQIGANSEFDRASEFSVSGKSWGTSRPYALQAKLEVGPADDMYEREADEVADHVMRQSDDDLYLDRKSITPFNSALQREVSGGAPLNTGGQSRLDYASVKINQSQGSSLNQADRNFFESRMGHDFQDVQIHDDDVSAEAAQLLQAKAFTIGNNIYFGANQNGSSEAAQRLMAHELTHVVQQRSATGSHHIAQRQSSEGVPELSAYDKVDRLIDTVLDSGEYVDDILGEVWESLEEHWPEFLATFIVILGVEILAAALAAAPEPTMATKIVALALQGLLILMYGTMFAVSAMNAVEAASDWYRLATKPDATQAELAEASRSFLKIILHLMLAILAAAGVRAKVSSARTTAQSPTRGGGSRTRQPTQSRNRTLEEARPPKKPSRGQGPAARLPDLKTLVNTPVERIVGSAPKYDAWQGLASAARVRQIAMAILQHKGQGIPAFLRKSIKIQPTDVPGRFAIVDGTHRYLALRLLGREVTRDMLDMSYINRAPVVSRPWGKVTWTTKELMTFGVIK